MEKLLLVSLNSKFIHSNLAIRYLNNVCKDKVYVESVEYSINDRLDNILESIFLLRPDVIGISCYIWNVEYVMKLSFELKKVLPDLFIFLGGPEVSYESKEILQKNSHIDAIISGEGEGVIISLIEIIKGKSITTLPDGLFIRIGEEIKGENFALYEGFQNLKLPYNEEYLDNLKNRIVYYESSRGCPFSCSYCISSTFKGVRYKNLDLVKSDIDFFISSNVPLVKFVDRTFNASPKRSIEIFEYIISKNSKTRFHFEVAGDIFNDEVIRVLQSAPSGLFQFEIGIQSTCEETLESINRTTNIQKLFLNINKLLEFNNIHIHLDLIAGLPYESFEIFKKSFNNVYSLKAHKLQLGFLKILNGTKLSNEISKYGYKFNSNSPYEIYYNKFITYTEILNLKSIEDILDKYYNSHRFISSLEFIIKRFNDDYFKFYFEFAKFLNTKNDVYNFKNQSIDDLYSNIYEFSSEHLENEDIELFKQILRHDFCKSSKNLQMPLLLRNEYDKRWTQMCFDYIHNGSLGNENFLKYSATKPTEIMKQLHFEKYNYNVETLENRDTVVIYDYKEHGKIDKCCRYAIVDFEDFH